MNPVEEEIERIREVRRRISAQCGDDPSQLINYYRKVSAKLRASGDYKFVESPSPESSEVSKDMLLRDKPPPSK